MHLRIIHLMVFAAILGASVSCTTPNRGTEPDTSSPLGESRWTQPQDGAFVVDKTWWAAMNDPALDELIEQAIGENIDLALLVDRTRSAEIELFGAKADKWPKLNATAGYTAVFSDNFDTDGFSIGAGLGWELDIWGRLSEKQESELLAYRATEADWRAGYLQVVGGICRTVVFIRQLDEQQQLHDETLRVSREILALFEQRQVAGLETSDVVATQRAEVLRLESQMREIESRRKLLLNELALLSGKEPGTVQVAVSPLRSTMKQLPLPGEIQANLLTRRPDLVAAELRVKSAYRMQESMRAARWPQVGIGVTSMTDPSSFYSSQWVALITPKISFPALDPQTKVRLKLSEVELEAAQKEYKQSVLLAVSEVAEAMIELGRHEAQQAIEAKRLAEYSAIRGAVKDRVDAGVATRIDLLGAKLNVMAVQQRRLDLYAQVLLDQIALHNALGGGW